MLGGHVTKRDGEYGHARLEVKVSDTLFRGTPRSQQVWMSHSDGATQLPKGAATIASTERCENAAFADFKRCVFGVQFHPEVVHTEHGEDILKNFVRSVCKIRQRSTPSDRIPTLVEQIRRTVGDRSVFFLVSGGVDSTVAFVLCARALPKDRILGRYVRTPASCAQGETDRAASEPRRPRTGGSAHGSGCLGPLLGEAARRHRAREEAPHHGPRERSSWSSVGCDARGPGI